MNKKILGSAIVMAFAAAGVSTSASAALASNAVLNFTAPTINASTGYVNATTGSWFAMDNDANSKIGAAERVGISSLNGLVLGTAQLASGSHTGAPGCVAPGTVLAPCTNAGENPNVDNAWGFFGSTGMHQTTSAATVLTAAGNSATVNLSGWSVTWNGIAGIPMGASAWTPTSGGGAGAGTLTNGVANITCAVDCFLACFDWLSEISNFITGFYLLLLQHFYIVIPAISLVFHFNYFLVTCGAIKSSFSKLLIVQIILLPSLQLTAVPKSSLKKMQQNKT